MTESTLWWLLAGSAIVIELLTGTFYLLMLSVGLAAGALAAHAGAGITLQMLVAALIGAGAVAGWHLLRKNKDAHTATGSNPNVNLDIGETVQVDSWNTDGSTSVKYRGAQWSAVSSSHHPAATGSHRIIEIKGSQLVLKKI